MRIPITNKNVRVTSSIKQRIINWLLSDEDVRIPAGVKFGPNSVTVGSPTADDIQFDADGGLAQQDGTVVASFPNDGSMAIGSIDNDDYHEKVVTQSGSTGSLDLSAANVFEQTVTGNITFSFNNPEGTPAGNSFLLIVIQDGTGGHTLSWPAAVEWGGGSAPGVSTAANDKHIFSFQSPDGGTTWYGFLSAENVA